MKALIIGTDFVKDSEGNLRILETNTNVGVHNKIVPDLDWVAFKQLLLDNSITKLHFISTVGNFLETETENIFDTVTPNVTLKDAMESVMNEIGGTFNHYEVARNSITVPFIEDADDTLIIRTSYDTTAIVDEEYTKDKVKFHRLIQNKTYSPNIYYSSSIDTELNIDQLTDLNVTSGSTPNYIIKTRNPITNHTNYPKLYKVESLEDLQILKNSLNELEYMEEYHTNSENIVNEKMGVIRSLDILYGPTLSCLHMGSYIMTSYLKVNSWETTYDTNGKMHQKARPLWISKGPIVRIGVGYILDDDTKILYSDNTLKLPNDIVENDTVKTLKLTWVPDDVEVENPNGGFDPLYITDVNSGNFNDDVNTFEISGSTVMGLTSNSVEVVMIRVTLENGLVYEDLPSTALMIEEFDTLQTTFAFTNRFRVNDSIVFYDFVNDTLVKTKITNLEIVYVNDRVIYDLDVESSDIFLPVAMESMGLTFIQHNGQCYGGCNYQAWKCSWWSCSACFFCDSGGKSDISYKENLKLIGQSPSGINIYEFNYIGEEGLYQGVIAQELVDTEFKSALSFDENGKYLVNYDKIDVEFKKIK